MARCSLHGKHRAVLTVRAWSGYLAAVRHLALWLSHLTDYAQVLSSDVDLLHPPAEVEKQKHKLKRLVQSPNSFFMDVKCQGCFQM